MHRTTKKLLFVFITIMAYLPMTVMNLANAVPNISTSMQIQSVTAKDTATMPTMSMMDIADCDHHQASKSCDHCSTQHSCHCVHSSCSVSLGITAHYAVFSNYRNIKDGYKALRIDTQFQQPTRLLRPPISI